jgi:hypothetical protein
MFMTLITRIVYSQVVPFLVVEGKWLAKSQLTKSN